MAGIRHNTMSFKDLIQLIYITADSDTYLPDSLNTGLDNSEEQKLQIIQLVLAKWCLKTGKKQYIKEASQILNKANGISESSGDEEPVELSTSQQKYWNDAVAILKRRYERAKK